MAKREITVSGTHAFVPLTQGHVAVIDAESVDLVRHWNWSSLITASGHVYARRVKDGKTILMHRVILGVSENNVFIDHIDGDGLNNTKGNLRIATPGQNRANSVTPSTNTSGIKGVHARGNSWVAQIQVFGKVVNLGSFDTKEQAAACYAGAAKIAFGSYLCLGDREKFVANLEHDSL